MKDQMTLAEIFAVIRNKLNDMSSEKTITSTAPSDPAVAPKGPVLSDQTEEDDAGDKAMEAEARAATEDGSDVVVTTSESLEPEDEPSKNVELPEENPEEIEEIVAEEIETSLPDSDDGGKTIVAKEWISKAIDPESDINKKAKEIIEQAKSLDR